MNKKYIDLGKKPNAIRMLYDYGTKQKELLGEDNVFDYSIGNPSAPISLETKKVLKDLLYDDNVHKYTSNPGLDEARRAIVEELNLRFNVNLSPKYTFISCGAAAALAITLSVLLEEDDEAIVFRPFFPEYKTLIDETKAKMVMVDPDISTFYPDLDDFIKKITDKTKVVIINSPNNPTGVIYKEDLIIKLTDILKDKEKEYHHPIYLISDEPYRELIYDDYPYPFITKYYQDSIICYSYSKSLSLAGERIGYIILNPDIKDVEDMFYGLKGAARALGYVCAPSMFQHMVAVKPTSLVNLSFYKDNRDLLEKYLSELGYEFIHSDGSFYLFVKALEEDSYHFMEVAKEYNLLLVPSDTFFYPGYVRLSYSVDKKMIIRSYRALKKLKERYQNERH